jgi:alpha-L-fucosidase
MKFASAAVKQIDKVIRRGPFDSSWTSLADYRIPQWYEDAKFGIFIHWGLYSVPAFGNEWYPRNMYLQDHPDFQHHVATYGPQSKFGYKDFIRRFRAEKFDPARWAGLFKRAGAQYVVPVAEHHDGFPMYDCSYSHWTAARMGPTRDIVAELAAAVRKEGMIFGVSSHRIEHWWFMGGGMEFDSDVRNPKYFDFYGPAKPRFDKKDNVDPSLYPTPEFMNDWLARTCELVDKYQPQLIWFDWWIEQVAAEPYVQKLAAYYYNRSAEWKRGVAINFKNQTFPYGTAVLDIERGQLKDIRPLLWQNDTSVSKNSWGYVKNQDYKTPTSLIHDLIDVVSKNGCLLLNIGPRPDGTIPEPEEQILLDMGRWLALNGEAVYGTRPWKVYGEGPTEVLEGGFTDTKRQQFTAQDVRFSTKGDVLYAILLGWPENGEATIQSLSSNLALYPAAIKTVSLLGTNEALQWARDRQGLRVKLPAHKPCDHAFVLKIEK